MKPETTRLVVILVVVALVLGAAATAVVALTSGSDDPGATASPTTESTPVPPPPAEEGASEPPSTELADFYSQKLAWESCGANQCATLTVPVDYQDPTGATIELALLKVPAGDPDQRVGSLVVNPGGPGAPGTSYAAQSDFVFRDPLRQSFDIVGFDPRGTGASSPIDCLSDDELDAFLAADPDPDDSSEGEELADSLEQFYEGCVESSDDLIAHVTTIETARDLDVLRAALGESELSYFGASYGTKLGATYAELFPDKVGRLLLDGAVDVALPSRELSLGQAGGFETALRAYVENCVEESPNCFLGGSIEEGLTQISDLLDAIDGQALPTGSDRELTVGRAFYGVVTPLYNRDYWYLLDQGLQSALEGDGGDLLFLADVYASREGDTYSNNSSEAIYAINCLDDPYAIEPSEVPAQFDDFEAVSPTFGRVFAWGLVGCRGIQVESTEDPLDIRAEGAAPIVVVGTTRDPATPYAWSEALAEQLESGVLITRDGDGHTGYNAGNACVDEAVEAYLIDGTVPEDGLSC